MYGFDFNDMIDIYGISIETAKNYFYTFQIEGFYLLFNEKQKHKKIETELIDNNVFSINEMHYGYTGESKYSYNTLSRQEQKIYNKF